MQVLKQPCLCLYSRPELVWVGSRASAGTSAASTWRLAAQVPISDLTPGEPKDLWLDLGKPESRAVNNPLDVGVQARPLLPGGAPRVLRRKHPLDFLLGSGVVICQWD